MRGRRVHVCMRVHKKARVRACLCAWCAMRAVHVRAYACAYACVTCARACARATCFAARSGDTRLPRETAAAARCCRECV